MIELMKTDEELLFAYQRRGDKAALELLIARHFDAAYRRAHRFLGDPAAADDAVQEALISLIRGARRFREGEPFTPWWTGILYNRIRNEARKLTAKKKRDLIVGRQRSRQAGEEKHADHHALHDGLEALPFELRAVLELHYFEGRSHKDIAATMDIPQGTASSRLRRGLDQLRSKLKAAGHGALATGLEKILSKLGAEAIQAPGIPALAALESLALKSTLKMVLAKAAIASCALALALGLAFSQKDSRAVSPKATTLASSPRLADPKAKDREAGEKSAAKENRSNSTKPPAKAAVLPRKSPANQLAAPARSASEVEGASSGGAALQPGRELRVLVLDGLGRPSTGAQRLPFQP